MSQGEIWEEYYMEDGVLIPTAVAEDFKPLLEWYFGGNLMKIISNSVIRSCFGAALLNTLS